MYKIPIVDCVLFAKLSLEMKENIDGSKRGS